MLDKIKSWSVLIPLLFWIVGAIAWSAIISTKVDGMLVWQAQVQPILNQIQIDHTDISTLKYTVISIDTKIDWIKNYLIQKGD